jgi:predicted aspartyl protease
MLRVAILLGLCLFWAGCASTPPPQNLASFDPLLIAQEPVARLSLVNAGNLQWRVRVVVDGEEGVFAIDTGSDTTILSPQFAQKIGRLDDAIRGQFTGPNQIGQQVRFVKPTYLQLGKIFYLGFYAPVLNLDHINRAMRTPIDGILGNNILRKTMCTIDWRNNLLTLDTGTVSRPDDAIPINLEGNRIYLTAAVNGHAAKLALDTGAYCSSLTKKEIRRLKIPASKQKSIITRQIDIADSRRAAQTQVTLDSFKLDKINRTNFPMLAWDNSVIGMDLLDSWILTLDEADGWLELKPY